MPPPRQNERSLQEMEEMRRQIQQLQEIVNSQQALLEVEQRRFEGDVSCSDSSSSRSSRSQRRQLQMNDIKVDIPDFEGNLQLDDFLDWLQTIERVFEYKEVLEEQKVKIVAAKLKKHALIWWENLKRRRKCEGKSKIKTWDKMRRKLTRKYLPPHYYQANFTQKQLSKKSSYQPFSSTENKIVSHKPLTHQPIVSFKPKHNTIIERNTKIPKCFICQGYGHIALDCVNHKVVNEEINNISEEEREDVHESFEAEMMGEPIYDEEYAGTNICEVFEEVGNIDPIYDDEYGSDDIHEVFEKEDKDEPIYDEEYVPTKYGDSLEVKRSMQITTDKEESCLKHNISHTSNTSQGKVCDIIINSGSCESVVLNYMVEKLELPTKDHPHPYKLHWLNKDNEVTISLHPIVSFSIEKNYKENVWRDVIPMDTCHIHLRRPWQYDRHTLYDGYANIYTFVKDGIKIKLTQLPLNEFNEREDECKSLEILVTKEPLKDTTKLCMSRPIPKPPWEVVIMDFPLDYYGASATFTVVDLSSYFDDEEDF